MPNFEEEINVSIFDMSGKILVSQMIAPDKNTLILPVNGLSRGIYVVSLSNKQHYFWKKTAIMY